MQAQGAACGQRAPARAARAVRAVEAFLNPCAEIVQSVRRLSSEMMVLDAGAVRLVRRAEADQAADTVKLVFAVDGMDCCTSTTLGCCLP